MKARTLVLLAACLASAVTVTACGKRGTLMPPDKPLWGSTNLPPAPVDTTKKSEKPDDSAKNPTPTP